IAFEPSGRPSSSKSCHESMKSIAEGPQYVTSCSVRFAKRVKVKLGCGDQQIWILYPNRCGPMQKHTDLASGTSLQPVTLVFQPESVEFLNGLRPQICFVTGLN